MIVELTYERGRRGEKKRERRKRGWGSEREGNRETEATSGQKDIPTIQDLKIRDPVHSSHNSSME